ncbi:MAG: undecaprenyl-diphosphate phosphatase [bacterium]
MNSLTAAFLGAIQGLTEFLPVSSSGHLALANSILKIPSDNLFFEVVLHLGTLFAVMLFMRKKIISLIKGMIREISDKSENPKKNLRYGGYIIAGIIPAVVFALIFDELIEKTFSDMRFVGIFFLITAVMLFATKFFNKSKKIEFKSALFIGIAQIIALFPGISRSGTTISSGIMLGIDREDACDFSFFMAMPLILGAFLKELLDTKPLFDFAILIGFLSAFVFGYFSVLFLYRVLKSNKFHYFSYYLAALGIFTIARSLL